MYPEFDGINLEELAEQPKDTRDCPCQDEIARLRRSNAKLAWAAAIGWCLLVWVVLAVAVSR